MQEEADRSSSTSSPTGTRDRECAYINGSLERGTVHYGRKCCICDKPGPIPAGKRIRSSRHIKTTRRNLRKYGFMFGRVGLSLLHFYSEFTGLPRPTSPRFPPPPLPSYALHCTEPLYSGNSSCRLQGLSPRFQVVLLYSLPPFTSLQPLFIKMYSKHI
jgi:hypothetical protein